jgi:tetratricopeptide (TPR) repeat protein
MITSLLRKAALVLFGAVLFFVLLEGGLRFGGFILSSMQESENLRSVKKKGTYRILCLGDSTTQGQYPKPLEQVLNQRNIGVHFSVIDKGKIATNSTFILSCVEAYLADYRPDMVVAMMGNNDAQVAYYEGIPESDDWLFRHCRAYRFSRILYMQLLKKLQKKDIYGLSRSDSGRQGKPEGVWTFSEKKAFANEILTEKAMRPDSESENGGFGPTSPAEAKRPSGAITLDPSADQIGVGLGYQQEGKSVEAEASFKKAIELDPKNDGAYFALGLLYRLQDRFSQAEDVLKKAIALNPENARAYHELKLVYTDQGKHSQAESCFKKEVELTPKQAIERYQAIELNPVNDAEVIELAGFYQNQNQLSRAEDLFKRASARIPQSRALLKAMALLYEEMGKPELSTEYSQKANQLPSEVQSAVTVNNYRKLKEILHKKGIQLVCVQYPMRNAEPLKKIFEKDGGVIFVDNESLFREAVKRSGYKEYFRDMFAGEFGHCTQKGNELLAQNIADVILKEVFHK